MENTQPIRRVRLNIVSRVGQSVYPSPPVPNVHNNTPLYEYPEGSEPILINSVVPIRSTRLNIINPAPSVNQPVVSKQKKQQIKWNLERVLKEAKEIHGEKYDYSMIQEKHIINATSKFTIKCNSCGDTFDTNIDRHIKHKKGKCKTCDKVIVRAWTYQRFLDDIKDNMDKLDYSLVKPEDIKHKNSQITIKCKVCPHSWTTTVRSHIDNKATCDGCKGIMKWNYETFMSLAMEKHPNCDYSMVPKNITGKSIIYLGCKICPYIWKTQPAYHVKSIYGCDLCEGGIIQWYYDIFIWKAKKIHDNKFGYSKINPEDIENRYSEIEVTCNKCINTFPTTVYKHLITTGGCTTCSRINIWTYEEFMKTVLARHGNKYDYNHIKPEDIKGHLSFLKIYCKICGHNCSATLTHHANGNPSCRGCSGMASWTVQTFIEAATYAHGDKFDYSAIDLDMKVYSDTRIPITCNECGYFFHTGIYHHVHHGGCRRCAGHLNWTKDEFIFMAKLIHGDLFNYNKIKDQDVVNTRSKVPIECRKCDYNWTPTVNRHINQQCGCPKCKNLIEWTLNRFLTVAKTVHGDKFDLSEVTEDDIDNGNHSLIPIKCNNCQHRWKRQLRIHINIKEFGCPKCNKESKGERLLCEYFEEMEIEFTQQFRLVSIPNRKFDFMFEINDMKVLLEFDGPQHFKYCEWFYKTLEIFAEKQQVDVIKTKAALAEGYYFIRLDYNTVDKIEQQLIAAIDSFSPTNKLYFSDPELYKYISNKL